MPTTLDLTGDLAIYAGDGYVLVLPLTNPDGSPFDPSGLSFAAQIRESAAKADVAAEFTIDVTDNEVALSLVGTETAELALVLQNGVWDLEVTELGFEPETWFRGDVQVQRDVTR